MSDDIKIEEMAYMMLGNFNLYTDKLHVTSGKELAARFKKDIEKQTVDRCIEAINKEQLTDEVECPEDTAYTNALDCAIEAIKDEFKL